MPDCYCWVRGLWQCRSTGCGDGRIRPIGLKGYPPRRLDCYNFTVMPTLFRFPLSRLALLRRAPFWGWAVAVCAMFAVVGVGVVDDYGIGWDEPAQLHIGRANADYIATGATDLLLDDDEYDRDRVHRYYGVAFEMPLFLVARALRLDDSRHIYLTRHLLTHLFFIAGGFACGMLAYRMMGSGWVALLAMLLFLLHPRLYAHSFFNSKDIPFAAMLVVALYLTRRAFRKDTLGAFLLCGIGAGLAIDLRPFGLMLLPMILAMRGVDLWQANKGERKRILASAGIFAGAALATAYLIHPYYWENPLRFIESVLVVSQHPTYSDNLFMGEIYESDAVPWNFIPVWFSITTPPLALALGALGAAAVCWQGISRPFAALRDSEIRFGVMLLGCFAMPVAVVIILQSNIYDGWRHMYFLWGPFCLLAAMGLHRFANISIREGVFGKFGARLLRRVRGGGLWRALAYGAAGFGLATTLTAMFALHPYEYVYFNGLVDTKTPGALAKRYDMDYWRMSEQQSMEYLLARYPDDALRVWMRNVRRHILPQNDRERIPILGNLYAADFYLWTARGVHLPVAKPQEAGLHQLLHPLIDPRRIPDRPPIHSVKAYGSAISLIYGKDDDAYRAAYADVVANGDVLARGGFDIYGYDGALYYLSADCAPPALNDADLRMFLHITPADAADLPAARRERGFENRDFRLDNRAAYFDGKCMHRELLPDYPIARIGTGQKTASGVAEWRADIDLAALAEARALYESIVAGDYGQPVARSGFDVYMRGDRLAYVKEDCAEGDAEARFFLHIVPVDTADLPGDRRERGFENRDFGFAEGGANVGGRCVVERGLPGYGIERVRTGQFVGGEGAVWRVEFAGGR